MTTATETAAPAHKIRRRFTPVSNDNELGQGSIVLDCDFSECARCGKGGYDMMLEANCRVIVFLDVYSEPKVGGILCSDC